MSMRLITNIIKQCKRKPSEKLMLIVLSDFANDKFECFPSFETLARLCNISTRQAQNIIYTLIKEGEIAVSRQKGGVNFYSILNYRTAITREPAYAGIPTKFSATNEISSEIDQLAQTPTHETHFVPPTKFSSPTHETHFVTPTKPTSSEPVIEPIEPPREPVKANYVVASVGDNTTHTPSTVSDNPTVTEQIGTPPTAKIQPTGTIASPNANISKAKVPNPETSITITGNATSSDLPTESNTKAHANNPPPVAPPREVTQKKAVSTDKAPRTYSDQQKMVSAIAKVFGWDMSKLTRNNRGLVGKVARDLLEASARPSDVQGLYDFCKSQNWSGSFTPSALSSQWANYYALKHKSGTTADYIENEAGMIFHRYVPDPNRPPMFNYNRPLITITEEELATGPQTLEECKAEFERVLAELTNKMTLKDDEVDLDAIPEDEELRAILW